MTYKIAPGFRAAILLALSSTLAVAAEPRADLVLRNAAVFTANAQQPWAEAVAVKAGKIVAVGAEADVKGFIGPDTRVMDLQGKMVMPGINDVHVHLPTAARFLAMYTCAFSAYAEFDEVLAAVTRCAQDKGKDDWIIGGSWGSQLYERIQHADALKALDRASGGRPVYLINDTIHDRWASSRALQLAGITKDTPNPPNGIYGKDSGTGELNGLLIEFPAQAAVEKVLPQTLSSTPDGAIEAIKIGTKTLNAMGVTGYQDAAVAPADAEAYHALDKRGELTARAALSMIIDPAAPRFDDLYAHRKDYRSERLSLDFAKIFLDGVGVSYTAVFLEPYLPDHEHGANFRGVPKVSLQKLIPIVTELDRRGITVKLHCAGDGSVHEALDAIAAARKANGKSGPMHQIAHGGYVTAADEVRYRDLNVALDASPTVWYPGPVMSRFEEVLGKDRADHFLATKDLTRMGVTIAGGTDWKTLPGEFSDLWSGIEGLVTRRNPTGKVPGALWPEQAVDVATALRIYTLNSARAMRIDKVTGSLEKGKSADLIVLDQNLFKVPADRISKTKVLTTIFEGKVVAGQ